MDFIKTEIKDDYALVHMDRGKVNALNHQFVEEIRTTFKTLEADDKVRGVILLGKPHYFSAGLDVIELYEYDKEKMDAFFISFGSMHIELAKFSKPFICGVTGHSPAGGCVIAVAADYRIMAEGEKYKIGLNEVAVNIQITQNLVNAYAFWLGHSKANEFILEGKLLNGLEGHRTGLVNELCPVDQVQEVAERKMKKYLWADDEILKNTKARIRHAWLSTITDDAEKDLEMARKIWWRDDIRMKMGFFVESLKSKNAK
ncbi:MAG: enoyl-CoA hydratase/isomerase family protein [Bacteroidota bacterium]